GNETIHEYCCSNGQKKNAIGNEKKIPWAPLPTDYHWYLTLATTTKDPSKRVALIIGRITFEDIINFDPKYVSRWHFIIITRQSPEIFEGCDEDVVSEYFEDLIGELPQTCLFICEILLLW
ncbi:unnamed protein product, partial [Rotaria sp. Silwood2]